MDPEDKAGSSGGGGEASKPYQAVKHAVEQFSAWVEQTSRDGTPLASRAGTLRRLKKANGATPTESAASAQANAASLHALLGSSLLAAASSAAAAASESLQPANVDKALLLRRLADEESEFQRKKAEEAAAVATNSVADSELTADSKPLADGETKVNADAFTADIKYSPPAHGEHLGVMLGEISPLDNGFIGRTLDRQAAEDAASVRRPSLTVFVARAAAAQGGANDAAPVAEEEEEEPEWEELGSKDFAAAASTNSAPPLSATDGVPPELPSKFDANAMSTDSVISAGLEADLRRISTYTAQFTAGPSTLNRDGGDEAESQPQPPQQQKRLETAVESNIDELAKRSEIDGDEGTPQTGDEKERKGEQQQLQFPPLVLDLGQWSARAENGDGAESTRESQLYSPLNMGAELTMIVPNGGSAAAAAAIPPTLHEEAGDEEHGAGSAPSQNAVDAEAAALLKSSARAAGSTGEVTLSGAVAADLDSPAFGASIDAIQAEINAELQDMGLSPLSQQVTVPRRVSAHGTGAHSTVSSHRADLGESIEKLHDAEFENPDLLRLIQDEMAAYAAKQSVTGMSSAFSVDELNRDLLSTNIINPALITESAERVDLAAAGAAGGALQGDAATQAPKALNKKLLEVVADDADQQHARAPAPRKSDSVEDLESTEWLVQLRNKLLAVQASEHDLLERFEAEDPAAAEGGHRESVAAVAAPPAPPRGNGAPSGSFKIPLKKEDEKSQYPSVSIRYTSNWVPGSMSNVHGGSTNNNAKRSAGANNGNVSGSANGGTGGALFGLGSLGSANNSKLSLGSNNSNTSPLGGSSALLADEAHGGEAARGGYTEIALKVEDQAFANLKLDLRHRWRFGRANLNDFPDFVTLNSQVVSKHHIEIWESGGKVFLQDVGSSGGTFLNKKRLSAAGVTSKRFPLNIFDEIRLGIDYMAPAAAAAGTSPKSDSPEAEGAGKDAARTSDSMASSASLAMLPAQGAAPSGSPDARPVDVQHRAVIMRVESLRQVSLSEERSALLPNESVLFKKELPQLPTKRQISVASLTNARNPSNIAELNGTKLAKFQLIMHTQFSKIKKLTLNDLEDNMVLVTDLKTWDLYGIVELENLFQPQVHGKWIQIVKDELIVDCPTFNIIINKHPTYRLQIVSNIKINVTHLKDASASLISVVGDFNKQRFIFIEKSGKTSPENPSAVRGQKFLGEALGKRTIKRSVKETRNEVVLVIPEDVKAATRQLMLLVSMFLRLRKR